MIRSLQLNNPRQTFLILQLLGFISAIRVQNEVKKTKINTKC